MGVKRSMKMDTRTAVPTESVLAKGSLAVAFDGESPDHKDADATNLDVDPEGVNQAHNSLGALLDVT